MINWMMNHWKTYNRRKMIHWKRTNEVNQSCWFEIDLDVGFDNALSTRRSIAMNLVVWADDWFNRLKAISTRVVIGWIRIAVDVVRAKHCCPTERKISSFKSCSVTKNWKLCGINLSPICSHLLSQRLMHKNLQLNYFLTFLFWKKEPYFGAFSSITPSHDHFF